MSLEKYIEFTDEHRWNSQFLNEELDFVFHTSVSIKGKTFIFGGLKDSKFNSKLYRISKEEIKEVKIQDGKLPTSKVFHSMNHLNIMNLDYIVIYGGYDKKLQLSNEMFVINNMNNEPTSYYIQNQSLPALAGHSTAIYKESKLLVFGGYGKNRWSNDLFIFNVPQRTIQNIDLKNRPPPRSGNSMILKDNEVYIFGGFNENGVLDEMWTFKLDQEDPICKQVKVTGPSLKICHSITLDYMTFGGFTGEQWVSYNYKLDIENMKWTLIFSENNREKPVAFRSVSKNNFDYFLTGGTDDQTFTYDYIKQILYYQSIKGKKLMEESDIDCQKKLILYEYNSTFLNNIFYDPSKLRNDAIKDYKKFFERQDPNHSDLIFFFNDEPIYAHRFVLLQIPKFQNLFELEMDQRVIKINMSKLYPTIDKITFEIFLKFIYTRTFYIDSTFFEEKNEPITKLYGVSTIFDCVFLKDILIHKVSFNTVYPTSFTLSINRLFNEIIKPIPISEIEKYPLINGNVNLITRSSFSEDSDEFFVQVSKPILIERSPFFGIMFESKFKESLMNEVEIKELTTSGLITILKYLYAGMIPEIKPENCIELYMTIHMYQLNELSSYLRTTLRENVDESNVFALYDISQSMDDKTMKTFCFSYIAKRLDTLGNTEEFEILESNLKDSLKIAYYQYEKKK